MKSNPFGRGAKAQRHLSPKRYKGTNNPLVGVQNPLYKYIENRIEKRLVMLSKNKYKPSYDNSYLGFRQKFIARLNPNYNDRNKSYYGKARVIEWEDGAKALISYNTIVAIITPDNEFHKMWGSYSATTMKHINTFCDDYEQPRFNKAEWVDTQSWLGSKCREFRLSHDMQFDRIKNTNWGW